MAKDYSYYFAQLRRIEDHREEKAEKEIRKVYKRILKETRQFISEEYYQLAEDGKLTFEILRSKGQDARFLAEVEQRLGDLSLDVSKKIKKTVEEMYVLSYEGLKEAVQKSKDAEEFRELLQIADTSTAQTMWATVDNTIMDIALEKNHKDITWDIKREVARSLMVGDRFETMAHRIADNLDRSYKKAILISRTEVGRVREAGHLASAKNLNEVITQGSSGLRMVKKWKSVKDGRVRDYHRSMHNKVVEMDEMFTLPDGAKTQAPKQSGVAKHDCNCRCTVLYPLMDDEEFFKATGKHFSPVNSAQQSKTINDVQNFDQMETYMKDNYDVKILSPLKQLDFEGVRQSMEGVESVLQQFPGAQKALKMISSTNSPTAFMETSVGGQIFFNAKNYASSSITETIKNLTQDGKNGFGPKNQNAMSIGAHEMGHILELALLEKDVDKIQGLGPAGKINKKMELWNQSVQAKRIVNKAMKQAGGNGTDLKLGISKYATVNESECLAEAVADYTRNGNNAAPLSKEIWKLLKGELS